jgi:hypothetical protein
LFIAGRAKTSLMQANSESSVKMAGFKPWHRIRPGTNADERDFLHGIFSVILRMFGR